MRTNWCVMAVVGLLRSEGTDPRLASVEGGGSCGRRCRLHNGFLRTPPAGWQGQQGELPDVLEKAERWILEGDLRYRHRDSRTVEARQIVK